MAYRKDVAFLEEVNPALIGRNAAEFRRLHTLIESADDAFRKAVKVEWESDARDRYVARLGETKNIADALAGAFRAAGAALTLYAEAVTTAKWHYKSGKYTEKKLSEVMARESDATTPTWRAAEPLRQWEDMRATTGVLDFLAELAVDVDAIREEADSFYNQTRNHYGDALRVESEARETCIADIKAAYRSIPEFQGTLPDPGAFLKGLRPLRTEARQASDNPYVRLPGAGAKVDAIPSTGSDVVVSETLMRISNLVDGLPDAQGNNYWLPSKSDEGRRDYISHNSELIKAAATESGLPPEMVAGIAWQEVEGDPGVLDDLARAGRSIIPGSEDPDRTSMGPLSIQVRRAAEVLGYDPQHLTETQREVVVAAVRDPAKNIFIASEYLAQLKAESGFADVRPEDMTREQMRELAARYNGGPYYESSGAQAYGRMFDGNLDDAGRALR
ncbi:lytic transglycosylase domain-containing protein [Streptomyces sp. NRRL S-237]|uniref:lytic transglycosylase domain-containing protein n=1 Tax=Streptomyces sp. NRRL S-237 TaxID=1463895 RepID=UPI0004C58934|nr:lytic transglycosylase domain-containing protein [Streptomyces sp. NRRL S-237]